MYIFSFSSMQNFLLDYANDWNSNYILKRHIACMLNLVGLKRHLLPWLGLTNIYQNCRKFGLISCFCSYKGLLSKSKILSLEIFFQSWNGILIIDVYFQDSVIVKRRTIEYGYWSLINIYSLIIKIPLNIKLIILVCFVIWTLNPISEKVPNVCYHI